MRRSVLVLSLILSFILATPFVMAAPSVQLAAPNQAGVTMGQLYYSVHDVEANQKFWVALGAVTVKAGADHAVLTFPNLLISLNKGESSGNSDGSVLDHVGFQVTNVQQVIAKMKGLGYRTLGAASGSKLIGHVFSPEGERIELLEDRSENVKIAFDDGKVVNGIAGGPTMAVPIMLHHLHFNVPESAVLPIKQWYIKNFGGVSCKRWHYEAVDFPGMNINISPDPKQLAPTKGRMLDHFGFEVKNLKAFCSKLKASGVKFDQPYTKSRSGLATAYLTDPWGNHIVLTEGLSQHH
jgi:hypothetical protein